MRHLIVGDSHVAAMKLGWDAMASENSETTLVFAAARGLRMRTIHVDGTTLTSSSRSVRRIFHKLTGSTIPITVDSFDKCWIVGGRLGFVPVGDLYLGYRSERHADLGSETQILSAAAWHLAETGVLNEASGLNLARSIADIGIPVGLIPTPMPSQSAFTTEPWCYLDTPELLEAISTLFSGALRDVGERVGASVHPQPADTLAGPTMTYDRFSRGSVGLLRDAPHDSEDHFHMSGEYGRRVIEEHIVSQL